MNKEFVGLVLGGLLISAPSFALPGDHGPMDRDFGRATENTASQVKQISGEGIVRCDGGCYGDMESCDLEFVRNDSETFDLENADSLKALHCQSHTRNLKVRLDGELTSRFLFWGGNLKLSSYRVTGEVPSKNCEMERGTASHHEFRGGADR